MKQRKLIFHIGPHKTGTSAIQNVLREGGHPNLLSPQVGLWVDGAHHGLVFNFYRDFSRPDVPRLDVSIMLDELGRQAAASSAATVLLSSEELGGRDLKPFHEAVLAALPPADWQTEILFTCREHFERASSLYNQRVKDAVIGLTSMPDAFLDVERNALCYRPALEALKADGFRVRVLDYHPASTFVTRFLSHLQIEAPEGYGDQFVNVSLSPVGLVAMLGINTLAPNLETREAAYALLRPYPQLWARSTDIFGQEIRQEVAPLFAEDRTYLEREFGVVRWASEGMTSASSSSDEGLALGPDDVAWLAEVSHGLGSLRGPLLEFTRRFVQATPSAWATLSEALSDWVRPR